ERQGRHRDNLVGHRQGRRPGALAEGRGIRYRLETSPLTVGRERRVRSPALPPMTLGGSWAEGAPRGNRTIAACPCTRPFPSCPCLCCPWRRGRAAPASLAVPHAARAH